LVRLGVAGHAGGSSVAAAARGGAGRPAGGDRVIALRWRGIAVTWSGWAVRRRRPTLWYGVGASEAAVAGGVHGFPVALTSFVGRDGPVRHVAGC